MASELSPIEIGALPELGRLVEEVRATGKSRRLRHNGADVALLTPLRAKSTPARRAGSKAPVAGLADRTAGALRQYRREPPAPRAEEKDAFALAVAQQVADSLDG